MNIYLYSRIIRDFLFFLALSDEETVRRDEAAAMRVWLVDRLNEIDPALLQQIADGLEQEGDNLNEFERRILSDLIIELQLHNVSSTTDQTDVILRGNGIYCQLARIIADIHLFFDLTGEDKLNLDDSVKMMEYLAGSLHELDAPFLRELVDAFTEIAPEYGEAGEAAVRDIARAYGLEELLAADDPVRLAQLEALNDAHEFEERDNPLEDFPGVDWRADVRRPYLAAS